MATTMQPPRRDVHYEVPNYGLLFGYIPRVQGRISTSSTGVLAYRFVSNPDQVDEALEAARMAMKAIKHAKHNEVVVKNARDGTAYIEIYTAGITGKGNITGFKEVAAKIIRIGIRMKNQYEVVPAQMEFLAARRSE